MSASMMWLFVVVLLLAALHYVVAVRSYGLLTPDGLFVVAQLLMTLGTLRLVDPDSGTDVYYGRLMAGAVVAYLAASLVTFLCLGGRDPAGPGPTPAGPAPRVRLVRPTAGIVAVTLVSVAVTLTYFAAVGYSAFVVGLRGLLNGTPEDVRSLRLESYAGENYLFPGYANQFRNVLLPALSVILAIWFFHRRGLFGRLVALATMGLAVLGLVGTGQRGAFFLFLLTLVVYMFLHAGRTLSRWMLLVPLLGIPVVVLATQVLGRSVGADGHPLKATASELYRRFLEDNQLTGLAAFQYTSQSPTRNGGEWLRSLLGILPGDRGSTLANEVFAVLYGSPVGTAPPSLWGSLHHNFGTVGVIVAAIVFGIGLQLLTFHAPRGGNSLQLMGYAGITVVLGTWVAGGPDTLLNTGLVAYGALWWWGVRMGRTGSPATVARPAVVPPTRQGDRSPPFVVPPATWGGRVSAGR